MSGRKSNILKPQEKRSKSATKRRPKNNLNALATAEKQYPTKTKIRRHRLGDDEFSQPTRKRVINDEEDEDDEDAGRSKRIRRDQDGSDIDGGSDSEGNEWKIGTVDSDNDSDIDSDEAMGESDEDKFEGFTFRGSSAMQKKGSSMKAAQAQKRKINNNQFDGDDGDILNEEFNSASDEEAEEEEDDLGEDAVDLATAWDMNEDSEAEVSTKASKEKRKQVDTMPEDEDDDGSSSAVSDDEEEGDDDEESDTSELSISDNEGDTKQGLTKLRRFVTSLGQGSGSATSTRPKTALPGGDPTEFGLAPSRKLTVADLIPSISDSRMKGALKHIKNEPSTKGTTGIPGKLDVPLPKRQQDSKWAKSLKQTGRTAWDEDARTEMADLARREEELQKRIQGKRIVDEDGEYLSSSSEDEDDSDLDMPGFKLREKVDKLERDGTDPKDSGPYSGLLSMKFMQNADAARKEANERELREVKRQLNGEESGSEEEDLQEEVGRRKFGTQSTKSSNKPSVNLSQKQDEGGQARNEGAENDSGSDSDIDIRVTPKPGQQSKAAPKKTARHDFEGTKQQSPEDDENPWLTETSKKNRSKKKAAGGAADVSLIANSSSIVAQEPKQQRSRQGYQNGSEKAEVANQPVDDDERSDDEDQATMPVLLQNEELIKRAFAGDEVLETFRKEKKKTVEEEDDKVVEDTLPGWGSWAGAGLSRSDKKRVKRTFTTVKGISADKRKDAKLDRVIINEKQVKKNNKYLASQLPHPFESKQQYERALRLPIGPEWTTKSTFQTATKPRVMIKQGVIKPIQRPTL
ncbi:small nucleolar ribonucleoprotein complex subunit Utp14 [Trichophyton equinum CBS 127.97]|uniref:Small nucleolar ribonucleoprotein complex subunit Utp14 n=1 Tax=Trichophyton equinum (strain ATCC MYA-4606 / CBS 127.97) TaxID=559882 RepID=F2PJR9_TRIEC|nr:small nucleolar ribonucleoprotein complex subunit Utp14 [Trichophyton equinum CBS 127.97]